MRVLMLAINREKNPMAVAPLGVAKLISSLRRLDCEVDFLDLCFTWKPVRTVRKKLLQSAPYDVIGISIRNLDDCVYAIQHSYISEAQAIVATIRQHSDAKIVIGGGAVSVMPEEVAKYLQVEYAIVGEGEENFPLLLQSFANSSSCENIPGLLYKDGSEWHYNPPQLIQSLDDLPIEAYDQMNYRRYFNHGGGISYQTKRGCPFNCLYCNYHCFEGKKIRMRSPQLCVDDLEKIVKDTGLRDFYFTDSVFNWPREHAIGICREIINRGLQIRWMAYCNPRGLDLEMVHIFKASGCVGLEISVDVVTEKMLVNMQKGFSQQDIQQSYTALNKVDLPFAVFLLFGGPGDSFADIEETQRLLQKFGKANAIFATLGIRVYPNTPIYKIAIDEGLLATNKELLTPIFYVSPQLSGNIMKKLDAIVRRNALWSSPLDWNSPLVKSIQWILQRFRVMPSWKDIEGYGQYMRRSSRNKRK